MADKSWALQQGYNLQLQELHICRQAKSRRKKKPTQQQKKSSKKTLRHFNEHKSWVIQFYSLPINCPRNIAIFGTEHSDFTWYRKLKLNLSRSYWCQHLAEEFTKPIYTGGAQAGQNIASTSTVHFRGTEPLTVKIDLAGERYLYIKKTTKCKA